MSRLALRRWERLGYAAAAGAGLGSLLFWIGYWFTFVRGDLQGPDFFSFYSAAKLYVLKGWFKSEFEGHGVHTMKEGSCWIQPPGIRHTVLGWSDDCEVLEVILPAEHETVNDP